MAILDAWSRRVVGYAISRSINARLVTAALKAAVRSRQPPVGCVHHSDRGSQYASAVYRKLLVANRLVGSMSRRGNPYGPPHSVVFAVWLSIAYSDASGHHSDLMPVTFGSNQAGLV